ncbi:MAG: peptidoglycan hydrolase [Thermoleophilia bacterium]|nr:peptidoglycan hydrolase [Thermoleophilia bacterium]
MRVHVRALLVVVTLTIGALLATGSASAAATVAPPRDVAVWLPYWTQATATRTLVAQRASISVADPFWYEARGATVIAAHPGAGNAGVVRALRGARIKVVPTVTTSFRGDVAERWLTSATWRRRHVATLAALVQRNGYDGIDLDYETIALTTSARRAIRIRAGFTALVRELCPVLRARGKQCLVTVMPRTSARFEVWHGVLIPAVYDYAALAAAADRMRVMAYDQHTHTTSPGPIAGMPWVRQVATYARSAAPVAKLELGIPLYGRNWGGGAVRVVLGPEAERLRRSVGAARRWSAVEQAPYFRYRGHVVWYNDGAAVRARARYARSLGFAGVALWAAGQELPTVWPALR